MTSLHIHTMVLRVFAQYPQMEPTFVIWKLGPLLSYNPNLRSLFKFHQPKAAAPPMSMITTICVPAVSAQLLDHFVPRVLIMLCAAPSESDTSCTCKSHWVYRFRSSTVSFFVLPQSPVVDLNIQGIVSKLIAAVWITLHLEDHLLQC